MGAIAVNVTDSFPESLPPRFGAVHAHVSVFVNDLPDRAMRCHRHSPGRDVVAPQGRAHLACQRVAQGLDTLASIAQRDDQAQTAGAGIGETRQLRNGIACNGLPRCLACPAHLQRGCLPLGALPCQRI